MRPALRYARCNPGATGMFLTTACPYCGTETTLCMSFKEFEKLMEGRLHVQEIFPDWSADARECLLSGLCKECWDKLPGDEDD